MSWRQVFLGWPMICLSVSAFAIAFIRDRSRIGFAGFVLSLPFLWYASHAPRGLVLSPILLATLALAAFFLSRGRKGWAAVSLVPFAGVISLLAVAVVSQW